MSKPLKVAGAKGVVPRLRFPQYTGTDSWFVAPVRDLVSTIIPPKKLLSAAYRQAGKFPIVDQSADYICGWTDDADALVRADFPVVVFGDHTCGLKLLTEPFAQGADGIKILEAKRARIDATFLYHCLSSDPVQMVAYRRHYGILKDKLVPFPGVSSGEQQRIADCLSSLDDVIAAHADRLAALKRHKQGLLEQLFPREGETVPRLRFPEFRNGAPWQSKKLVDIAHVVRGGSPRPIADYLTNDSDGLAWLKIGDVSEGAKYIVGTAERIKRAGLSKTREIHSGDLILSNSMSFGRPYLSKVSACIHDGWLAITDLAQDLSSEFMYYVLTAGCCQQYFADAAAGSGVHNLNIDIVEAAPIMVPDTPEQVRVATCLSTLDALITAESDRLAALKQHKQGLLQQLFPVMDEATA